VATREAQRLPARAGALLAAALPNPAPLPAPSVLFLQLFLGVVGQRSVSLFTSALSFALRSSFWLHGDQVASIQCDRPAGQSLFRAMAQRAQVLQLYRSLMRAGRTWPTVEEREYILSESRRLFRQNVELEDPAQIDKKLFEATSRWELAKYYGIAAPRYFYNQPGVVEKARNKTAINVRPAYLDSEYESIGRGQGDDERNRRSIVGGSVPERAARAAAAAAAAAERSARGAILSAMQDPHEAAAPAARGGHPPTPPGLRAPPQPPGLRRPGGGGAPTPPSLRQPPSGQVPPVPVPPALRRPADEPAAAPAPAAAVEQSAPAGASSGAGGSGSSSGSSSGSGSSDSAGAKATRTTQKSAVAAVRRNKRKTGVDRSRHRVPTHL
jgi:uncharacterized membrane protein YgcG